MGSTVHAADHRRFARTLLVLTAALSLVATQFAGLMNVSAEAEANFTYNGFIDLDFGSDSDVTVEDFGDGSDDVDEVYGVDELSDGVFRVWIGDRYVSEPSLGKSTALTGSGNHEFDVLGTDVHISCSATLVDDTYTFGTLGSATITGFETSRWKGTKFQTSCDPETFDSDPVPDAEIAKSVDVAAGETVGTGDTFTYTLDVDYTGDDAATATDVTVTDELDLLDGDLSVDNVEVDGADGLDGECTIDNDVLSCDLDDLDMNSSTVTITITLSVDGELADVCGKQVLNDATVSWTGGSDDSNDVTVNFDQCTNPQPNLTITKSVDVAAGETVGTGDTFTYTLDVDYTGDDAATATDVTVTDELDLLDGDLSVDNVEVDGADGLDGECTIDNDVLSCDLDDLDMNSSTTTITITLSVDGELADVCGQQVLNDATVSWTGGSDDSNDVTVNFDQCTNPQPNLTITKSASSGSVARGGSFDYTLEVTNDGDAVSGGFSLIDDIPAPFTVSSYTAEATGNGDSWDASEECYSSADEDFDEDGEFVDCFSSNLDVDATFSVTITVDVPNSASCETVNNEAILYEAYRYMAAGLETQGLISISDGLTGTQEIDRDDADIDVTGCGGGFTPPGDGEVTVAKVVTGDAPADLDDFGFELVCGSMTEEFGLTHRGSATFDVDDNSSCTVEEVDTQGADGTSWVISGDATGDGSDTQTISFDVDEGDEITVTFTNAYPAVGGELEVNSDISIVKTATEGVDEDEDGGLTVTLDVDDEATVTYQYLITNEGEDALTDLSLIDDKLGDLSAAFVAAVVAQYGDDELPIDGAVLVEADHDVTQSSFTDDELVNIATVTAIGDESGDEVSDNDNETVGLVKVLAENEEKDDDKDDEKKSVVESEVDEIAFTGSDTTMLTGIGLTTALLGFAALLFTGRKRREE